MFQTRIPIYKPKFKDDMLKNVDEIKELVIKCIGSGEINLLKKEPYYGSILNILDEDGSSTTKQIYLAHTILCKNGVVTLENADYINNLELKNHYKNIENEYEAKSKMCLGVSAEIMDKIGNINQPGPPGAYPEEYSS